MQQGQLSFDFIFSILAALLLLQTLNSMLPELLVGPTVANIRTQHVSIEKGLESIALSGESLAAGSAKVEYFIPFVRGRGFEKTGCAIAIRENKVYLSTPKNTKHGINADVNTVINSNVLYDKLGEKNFSCGSRQTIVNRA